MKIKSLLAAAVLSCSFFAANAQKGPHIGIVTAYNSTWVLDSKLLDDPNYDSHNTWNSAPFGVVLGYKFNPASSFQIEFSKTNMGAEFDILGAPAFGGATSVVGKKRIETQYWTLPVLYKFTTGEKVRFNFHLGPQLSFLSEGTEVNEINEATVLRANLSSTDLTATDIKTQGGAPATSNDTEIPNKSVLYKGPTTDVRSTKSDFNKTDIGAAIGLGLEADLVDNLYLSLNARLYYGFKDIRSDARVQEAKDRSYYDSRNNVTGGFQLGLHYRFDL